MLDMKPIDITASLEQRMRCRCSTRMRSAKLEKSSESGWGQTVDLCSVTTTPYANADVNLLELLSTDQENGFGDLVTEGLRHEKLDGGAVDLEEALALLHVGNGDGIFLQQQKKRS